MVKRVRSKRYGEAVALVKGTVKATVKGNSTPEPNSCSRLLKHALQASDCIDIQWILLGWSNFLNFHTFFINLLLVQVDQAGVPLLREVLYASVTEVLWSFSPDHTPSVWFTSIILRRSHARASLTQVTACDSHAYKIALALVSLRTVEDWSRMSVLSKNFLRPVSSVLRSLLKESSRLTFSILLVSSFSPSSPASCLCRRRMIAWL